MNKLSNLSGQFKKILQVLFKPIYSFFTNSVVSEKNNSMQLSFIIGAGFSAPDKYPTRKELNERLRKITHDEIIIHTDGSAWFLNVCRQANLHRLTS
jgi:hypothetical protein